MEKVVSVSQGKFSDRIPHEVVQLNQVCGFRDAYTFLILPRSTEVEEPPDIIPVDDDDDFIDDEDDVTHDLVDSDVYSSDKED
ncbi:hypothetical protein Tco_1017819 [Tanacetum coccineum]|uniref:Uncharacterized protein n=1 Tax=Tanacetum coccineum TaxID=301880 RepID=A0ABQ5FSY4_9ASTR